MDTLIAQVALPVPIRHSFDFLVPANLGTPLAGSRVKVPFGRRRLIGVVIGIAGSSDIPHSRLRQLEEIIDATPVFSGKLMDWLLWIADYYHHPVGEVLSTALPVALRQGQAQAPKQIHHYRLTPCGRSAQPDAARAPLQAKIRDELDRTPSMSPQELTGKLGVQWRRAMPAMLRKGWVETTAPPIPSGQPSGVELNTEQVHAVSEIAAALDTYKSFLLFGVTGSGKTEVYLELMRQVIGKGQQVLVLVPEIGLTPQLVSRFERSLNGGLVVLHSELSAVERHRGWAAARGGTAAIVLGTRSAVFTPLRDPGLIVIDEEHDLSFKQQEGLRYHARDVAVLRAKREGIPIVLGSATPSFESMANVDRSRYEMLKLSERALGANMPTVNYIDMRKTPATNGLTRGLLDAIELRLSASEQSLIFVNRRGYAPVLFCTSCGWQAACERCDTRLIFHKSDNTVRCHHCGSQNRAPEECPDCGGTPLLPLGEGTQRLESHLQHVFPSARIIRIDRDSTRRKGELEQRLNQAASGEADIMIGTQLLAKGHHFPLVTLVGVVDADQGLYSVDFRAAEHLFQQIVQVAGRAGRAGKPGQVLIQTVYPDHPHFTLLATHDYTAFVHSALRERSQALHPPYAHFALLRAESTQSGAGLGFLRYARKVAISMVSNERRDVQIMDPVPSPMEKRAGRYRAQLLISSLNRHPLHDLLSELVNCVESHETARRVRWSIDVDPMEMY